MVPYISDVADVLIGITGYSGRIYNFATIAAKFSGIASLGREVEDHIDTVAKSFDAAKQTATVSPSVLERLQRKARARCELLRPFAECVHQNEQAKVDLSEHRYFAAL